MDDKLQEVMDRVRETAATVSNMAGYGVQKAGEAIDATRLNVEIMGINGEINQQLREIGEHVYATHCGELTDSEALLGKLRRIDELKLEIRLRQQEISGKKGLTLCPQCGKEARPGDVFCRDCGAVLR